MWLYPLPMVGPSWSSATINCLKKTSLVLDQLSSQTSKSKNPSQWKCGNGLDGVGAWRWDGQLENQVTPGFIYIVLSTRVLLLWQTVPQLLSSHCTHAGRLMLNFQGEIPLLCLLMSLMMNGRGYWELMMFFWYLDVENVVNNQYFVVGDVVVHVEFIGQNGRCWSTWKFSGDMEVFFWCGRCSSRVEVEKIVVEGFPVAVQAPLSSWVIGLTSVIVSCTH